jgi:hypothetical protein
MTLVSNWTFLTNANNVYVKIIDATLRAETRTTSVLVAYFRFIAETSSFWEQKWVRGDLFDALPFDWNCLSHPFHPVIRREVYRFLH